MAATCSSTIENTALASTDHECFELELDILVIDSQHHRIVEFINGVTLAQNNQSNTALLRLLDNLSQYIHCHFKLEEELMEISGSPISPTHKKQHQLFSHHIEHFQQRAQNGYDISSELLQTLKAWLTNHIKQDDRTYAEVMRTKIKETALKVITQKKCHSLDS